MLKAAGCGFRDHASELGGVTLRHHQGIHTKRRRRTQDRTGIVRVGDLIEHQHNTALRNDAGEIETLQRLRLKHDALMHGTRAKPPGEILGRHEMERKARAGDFVLEPMRGGFRGINIEDFSPLDTQCFANRVKAVKDNRAASRLAELWRVKRCVDFPGFEGLGCAGTLSTAFGGRVWARRRIWRVFMFGGGGGSGAGAI